MHQLVLSMPLPLTMPTSDVQCVHAQLVFLLLILFSTGEAGGGRGRQGAVADFIGAPLKLCPAIPGPCMTHLAFGQLPSQHYVATVSLLLLYPLPSLHPPLNIAPPQPAPTSTPPHNPPPGESQGQLPARPPALCTAVQGAARALPPHSSIRGCITLCWWGGAGAGDTDHLQRHTAGGLHVGGVAHLLCQGVML